MKHDIAEKDGTVVGYAEVLDDKDLSITFHDTWVGVFSTFEAWNCQHGGAYMLVVDAPRVVDFQLYDISLVAEDDLSESDDYIKVPIGDEMEKIQWDTCNFKDDPLAFVKHTYPDGVPTLHEYQKQFLHKIAESMAVPWLCRKS